MKLMNSKNNSVFKRHCCTLLRKEGGVVEAASYKRDSEGVCWIRVKNRGGQKCKKRPGEGKKGRVKKHVSIQKELGTREVTQQEGKKERKNITICSSQFANNVLCYIDREKSHSHLKALYLNIIAICELNYHLQYMIFLKITISNLHGFEFNYCTFLYCM